MMQTELMQFISDLGAKVNELMVEMQVMFPYVTDEAVMCDMVRTNTYHLISEEIE